MSETSLPAPPPTPAEWRAAMGYFPSGVTVVTTWEDGAPVGSTINAFCSVSLNPPLLLICLAHANPIRFPVEQSGVFGVHILHEEGQFLARKFSLDPKSDRFSDIGYRAAPGGAPQLDIAPIFIDCVLDAMHRAGDHMIAVGRGVRIERGSAATPLLYHRGGFSKLMSP